MTPRFYLFSGSFSWLFFVLIHLFSSETKHDFNNESFTSLYLLFLGVFIIYVIDSFAKVGKYIR